MAVRESSLVSHKTAQLVLVCGIGPVERRRSAMTLEELERATCPSAPSSDAAFARFVDMNLRMLSLRG